MYPLWMVRYKSGVEDRGEELEGMKRRMDRE